MKTETMIMIGVIIIVLIVGVVGVFYFQSNANYLKGDVNAPAKLVKTYDVNKTTKAPLLRMFTKYVCPNGTTVNSLSKCYYNETPSRAIKVLHQRMFWKTTGNDYTITISGEAENTGNTNFREVETRVVLYDLNAQFIGVYTSPLLAKGKTLGNGDVVVFNVKITKEDTQIDLNKIWTYDISFR
jgi:hypothetical protein